MWISAADEETLARLGRLKDGPPVLSLYLAVEKGLALHHGHIAAAMDTLRALKAVTAPAVLPDLEVESGRALSWLRSEYVPHGNTLALFAGQKRRLWEVISLQLPVRSIARFNSRPYVAPIEALREDNPRTAVALVNNEAARIFTMTLGELETEHKVRDAVPGRQRQGGWSAFRYQRDRERHIHTHLVHVVDTLLDLEKSRAFKRLVLAGTEEATDAVAGILPPRLQRKYCGSFRMEMFRSDDEVVKGAQQIAEQAEREEERALAQTAVERALKGGKAALGWEETLTCLNTGRVHQLLIAEDACGSGRGDTAYELAWDSGASIEVVHAEAARMLDPYDGFAGLLRY